MSATINDAAIARKPPRAPPANRRGFSLPGQFMRYLFCAGCAALVNFAAGSFLVDGCGLAATASFPAAVAAAYALGMTVNFLANRRFTFACDRTAPAQARTFIAVALSGLALTTALATLSRPLLASAIGAAGVATGFAGRLGSPETLSRLIAIGLASLYSFCAHKCFTFNRGLRPPLLRLIDRLGIRRLRWIRANHLPG